MCSLSNVALQKKIFFKLSIFDCELQSNSNAKEEINDKIEISATSCGSQSRILNISIVGKNKFIMMHHSWIIGIDNGVKWNLDLEAKILSNKDSIKFFSLAHTYYNQRMTTSGIIGKYSIYFNFRMKLLPLDPSQSASVNYRSLCFTIRPVKNDIIKKIEITPLRITKVAKNYLSQTDLPPLTNLFTEHQYCFIIDYEAIRIADNPDINDPQHIKFRIAVDLEKENKQQISDSSSVNIKKILFINQPSIASWNGDGLFYKYQTYVYKFDHKYGIIKKCNNLDTNKRCNRGNVVCKNHQDIGPNCMKLTEIHQTGPCTENGVWTEGNLTKNSFSIKNCKCETGYFGKTCQYQSRCINCETNQCTDDNVCLTSKNHWRDLNFYKLHEKNICGRGIVSLLNKTLECKCNKDFTGKRCEINIKHFCGFNYFSLAKGELKCENIVIKFIIKYLYFVPVLILLMIIICLIISIFCIKKLKKRYSRPNLTIRFNSQEIHNALVYLQRNMSNLSGVSFKFKRHNNKSISMSSREDPSSHFW